MQLNVDQISKDASDFLRSIDKLYDAERATEEARQLHEGIIDLAVVEGTYPSDGEASSKRRSSERIKKDKEMKVHIEEEEGEKRVIRKRAKRVKQKQTVAIDDSDIESSIDYETDYFASLRQKDKVFNSFALFIESTTLTTNRLAAAQVPIALLHAGEGLLSLLQLMDYRHHMTLIGSCEVSTGGRRLKTSFSP